MGRRHREQCRVSLDKTVIGPWEVAQELADENPAVGEVGMYMMMIMRKLAYTNAQT